MTQPTQPTDGALLAEFLASRNQAAFTELVNRHGAMVHGVALRVLADHHEAQDVMQAVFLTLARKAASLTRAESVGDWLHTVAWRTAMNAHSSRHSRQQREQRAMRDQPLADTAPPDAGLFRAELDAALNQLPERYRQPLVLFHLEGQSLDEIGTALGLNPNTLRTRLGRARELLRRKLVRRGVAVGSVGALTVLLSAESGAAVLPPTIVASTVGAATGTAAVSASVAALTKGALNMLFWNSVKTVALTAACAGLVGTSVVVAQKAAEPMKNQALVFVDDNRRVAVESSISARVDNLLFYVDANDQRKLICREYGEQGKTLWTISLPAIIEKLEFDDPHAYLLKVWPGGQLVDGKTGAVIKRTPSGINVSRAFHVPSETATGDPGKVFKAIDTTQPGMYADGKWSYALEIKGDQRQGFLKYDGRDLPDPQPGDYLLTPWGWMQWQEQGHWLPVAEKPAKGKQLPDPSKP